MSKFVILNDVVFIATASMIRGSIRASKVCISEGWSVVAHGVRISPEEHRKTSKFIAHKSIEKALSKYFQPLIRTDSDR